MCAGGLLGNRGTGHSTGVMTHREVDGTGAEMGSGSPRPGLAGVEVRGVGHRGRDCSGGRQLRAFCNRPRVHGISGSGPLRRLHSRDASSRSDHSHRKPARTLAACGVGLALSSQAPLDQSDPRAEQGKSRGRSGDRLEGRRNGCIAGCTGWSVEARHHRRRPWRLPASWGWFVWAIAREKQLKAS